MIRTLLTLAAGIGVGVAVTFAADHDHHKAVKVTHGTDRETGAGFDRESSATRIDRAMGGETSRTRRPGPVRREVPGQRWRQSVA